MKKFLEEFRKFIMRGNVVDMAVGVVVGSAFTAIVNAISNNIFKPIVNYLFIVIFGKDSLTEVHTFLHTEMMVGEDGVEVVDLTKSIYIDWGLFVSAVVNFFIIAFVLFCIVKTVNNIREEANENRQEKLFRRELRKNNIKPRDKAAVEAYLEQKKAAEAAAAEEAALKEAEERAANPTTEDLLKQILEQIKK